MKKQNVFTTTFLMMTSLALFAVVLADWIYRIYTGTVAKLQFGAVHIYLTRDGSAGVGGVSKATNGFVFTTFACIP